MTEPENRQSSIVNRQCPVVGVIGGIGSGKSQVARILAELGAEIVSGDDMAHEALRQPELKAKVVENWGRELLGPDGEIQRRKLGAIVFADPAELRKLEEIVHPYIKRRLREEVDRKRREGRAPLLVLDAAVMLEAGWADVCDEILFVDVPRDERLARVARQRGWAESELAAREGAQMPLDQKRARADVVIDNSGPPDALRSRVETLWRSWGLPPRKRPSAPDGLAPSPPGTGPEPRGP